MRAGFCFLAARPEGSCHSLGASDSEALGVMSIASVEVLAIGSPDIECRVPGLASREAVAWVLKLEVLGRVSIPSLDGVDTVRHVACPFTTCLSRRRLVSGLNPRAKLVNDGWLLGGRVGARSIKLYWDPVVAICRSAP